MTASDGVYEEASSRGTVVTAAAPPSLADLVPGARAVVTRVVADGVPVASAVIEPSDAVVEAVRRAPLRDPVLYRVKDYEVCLRRAQAACVHIVEVER